MFTNPRPSQQAFTNMTQEDSVDNVEFMAQLGAWLNGNPKATAYVNQMMSARSEGIRMLSAHAVEDRDRKTDCRYNTIEPNHVRLAQFLAAAESQGIDDERVKAIREHFRKTGADSNPYGMSDKMRREMAEPDFATRLQQLQEPSSRKLVDDSLDRGFHNLEQSLKASAPGFEDKRYEYRHFRPLIPDEKRRLLHEQERFQQRLDQDKGVKLSPSPTTVEKVQDKTLSPSPNPIQKEQSTGISTPISPSSSGKKEKTTSIGATSPKQEMSQESQKLPEVQHVIFYSSRENDGTGYNYQHRGGFRTSHDERYEKQHADFEKTAREMSKKGYLFVDIDRMSHIDRMRDYSRDDPRDRYRTLSRRDNPAKRQAWKLAQDQISKLAPDDPQYKRKKYAIYQAVKDQGRMYAAIDGIKGGSRGLRGPDGRLVDLSKCDFSIAHPNPAMELALKDHLKRQGIAHRGVRQLDKASVQKMMVEHNPGYNGSRKFEYYGHDKKRPYDRTFYVAGATNRQSQLRRIDDGYRVGMPMGQSYISPLANFNAMQNLFGGMGLQNTQQMSQGSLLLQIMQAMSMMLSMSMAGQQQQMQMMPQQYSPQLFMNQVMQAMMMGMQQTGMMQQMGYSPMGMQMQPRMPQQDMSGIRKQISDFTSLNKKMIGLFKDRATQLEAMEKRMSALEKQLSPTAQKQKLDTAADSQRQVETLSDKSTQEPKTLYEQFKSNFDMHLVAEGKSYDNLTAKEMADFSRDAYGDLNKSLSTKLGSGILKDLGEYHSFDRLVQQELTEAYSDPSKATVKQRQDIEKNVQGGLGITDKRMQELREVGGQSLEGLKKEAPKLDTLGSKKITSGIGATTFTMGDPTFSEQDDQRDQTTRSVIKSAWDKSARGDFEAVSGSTLDKRKNVLGQLREFKGLDQGHRTPKTPDDVGYGKSVMDSISELEKQRDLQRKQQLKQSYTRQR